MSAVSPIVFCYYVVIIIVAVVVIAISLLCYCVCYEYAGENSAREEKKNVDIFIFSAVAMFVCILFISSIQPYVQKSIYLSTVVINCLHR